MRNINLFTKHNRIILEIIENNTKTREDLLCFSFFNDMIIYYPKSRQRTELSFKLWDVLRINWYTKQTKYFFIEKQMIKFVLADYNKRIRNIIKYIRRK